jgi:hypothetical protein
VVDRPDLVATTSLPGARHDHACREHDDEQDEVAHLPIQTDPKIGVDQVRSP